MAKKVKVLLIKQEPKLGQKGDIVEVSHGFARNYLLPQGIALLATPDVLKKFENEKTQKKEKKQEELTLLKPVLDKITSNGLEFAELTNENGQLFGSINEDTLKKNLLQKYALNIENKDIKIRVKLAPDSKNIIRHLGSYKATLSFHQFPEITVDFPLDVKALKR